MIKRDKIRVFHEWRSIRKPIPKPTRAHNPKKAYDRKDKSWKDDI